MVGRGGGEFDVDVDVKIRELNEKIQTDNTELDKEIQTDKTDRTTYNFCKKTNLCQKPVGTVLIATKAKALK